MVKTHYIDFDKELTESQIKELEDAENAPYVPDEDCPPLTDEQLRQFKRISSKQQKECRKHSVTIRHSPKIARKEARN